MSAIRFEHVDVVFAKDPTAALALMDQGEDRETILERTGAVVGVHGAHLGIEPGEICVLMGLSGSGKSSLLRSVNGLNRVSRGRVLVSHEGGEVDIGSAAPAQLRDLRMNRISMVFQQFALMPWRTVRDNVGLGLELRGIHADERERRVAEKLALVRLEPWAHKRPHELSGGMQQRVSLARAFALRPPVLLMDEPFAALDEITRSQMRYLLLDVWRDTGATVVFVTHSIDEAVHLSDRVLVLTTRPGRLSAEITIKLDRPRRPGIEDIDEFHHHAAELRAALNAANGRSNEVGP